MVFLKNTSPAFLFDTLYLGAGRSSCETKAGRRLGPRDTGGEARRAGPDRPPGQPWSWQSCPRTLPIVLSEAPGAAVTLSLHFVFEPSVGGPWGQGSRRGTATRARRQAHTPDTLRPSDLCACSPQPAAGVRTAPP